MSTTNARNAAATGYELAAFLNDRESEAVFQHFVKRQTLGVAHVQRGSATQATAFVERQTRSPNLLVVDISGIDMPLPAIDQLADACEPGVTVIVVGDQHDVGLFRQLLALGVTDYLVKPLTVELIAQTIGNDLEPATAARGSRVGKLVTLTGARGGVGTTSLATSLAWLIANRMSRRVAFVDLDPHGGGGAIMLDVESGGLTEAVTNAARLDALFLDRTMIKHGQRLFCLGAQAELDETSHIDTEAFNSVLNALEQQFHYVVVDLPRRPGPLYRFTLQRSAVQIVVLDRTLPAVHNTVRMLSLIEGLGRRTLLVLNDHHPPSQALLDQEGLERSIGRSIDFVIPFDRTAPDRSDNLGEPLATGQRPFAAAIRELAADLSGQRLRRRSGWRGLLGGR